MFAVVWTSDVSGYVFGRILKGPKFFSSISPNKTWSGFLSGVLLSGLFSLFLAFYVDSLKLLNNFYTWCYWCCY